uniref:Uncharacterized protein n=1 Tax=Glossina brevipalpis TaxID=37001 RepID=A0A1A9W0J6_9MUSC
MKSSQAKNSNNNNNNNNNNDDYNDSQRQFTVEFSSVIYQVSATNFNFKLASNVNLGSVSRFARVSVNNKSDDVLQVLNIVVVVLGSVRATFFLILLHFCHKIYARDYGRNMQKIATNELTKEDLKYPGNVYSTSRQRKKLLACLF